MSHQSTSEDGGLERFREYLCLLARLHQVSSVSCSPDGTRIASGGFNGTVKVWDARALAPVLVVRQETAKEGVEAGPVSD